jgi:hypothetical protein
MTTEARDLHEIISASVRDMLDAYRIQAQTGHVKDQALQEIIYRAAQPIVAGLPAYSAAERGALLPSVVRLLLASFLENQAGPCLLIDRLRLDTAAAITVNPVRGPRIGRRAARGQSEGQR